MNEYDFHSQQQPLFPSTTDNTAVCTQTNHTASGWRHFLFKIKEKAPKVTNMENEWTCISYLFTMHSFISSFMDDSKRLGEDNNPRPFSGDKNKNTTN